MPPKNPHIPGSHPTPILQDFHYDPDSIINSLYAPNASNLPPGEINVSTNLPINPSLYSPIASPDPEESEDVLTNEIYVPSQLLDLYTLKGSKMLGSLLNPDLTTQYPATVTGTPNASNNPGGPIVPFRQIYNFARNGNTYLNHINNLLVDNSELSNTSTSPTILAITNLDTEHIGVNGGPLSDITTVYSPLNTGTPTSTANPGAAPIRFTQPYLPSNTYLTNNPIEGVGSGKLDNSLNITNLDVEDSGVNGGFPTDPLNDPTLYPITTTHTSPIRGYFAEPSIPFSKFTQSFSPNGTYLTFIENGKDIYNKPYI